MRTKLEWQALSIGLLRDSPVPHEFRRIQGSGGISARIWSGAYRRRQYPSVLANKLSEADAEAAETQVWLDFSKDCGYLDIERHAKLIATYEEVGRILYGMMANPSAFKPHWVGSTATATATACATGPAASRMHVIVTGPAGAGKTTIGRLLATRLGWPFHDADAVHPASNVAKMTRGEPLTDEDRWAWLDDLHALLRQSAAAGTSIVLACSALKQVYRDRLGAGIADVVFVFLKADREVLRERLESRRGHFMPAALLDSQLNDLEEPLDALVVGADQPPEAIVDTIVRRLKPWFDPA